MVTREFTGSILDNALLERILAEFEIDLVFHLAALLSTRSEFTPVMAHQVNVEGTLTLLEFAQKEGESKSVELLIVKGVNHLLVPAVTGEVKEYGALTDRNVSMDISAALASWLTRTFAAIK